MWGFFSPVLCDSTRLLHACVIFLVLPPAAQVFEELEAGGAFEDNNISRSNLFLSVHDAIMFAQHDSAERRVSPEVGSNNFIIYTFSLFLAQFKDSGLRGIERDSK